MPNFNNSIKTYHSIRKVLINLLHLKEINDLIHLSVIQSNGMHQLKDWDYRVQYDPFCSISGYNPRERFVRNFK